MVVNKENITFSQKCTTYIIHKVREPLNYKENKVGIRTL